MPIALDLLEATQPVIEAIASEPDLEENFKTWSQSRTAFKEDMNDPESEAAAEQWQKTYHQGRKPDGRKPNAKHRTKLLVKTFQDERTG